MAEIKEKQLNVLRYVDAYVQEHGYAPSVREIAAALHLSSPSTAHYHLKKLEAAGYLNIGSNRPRALAVQEHTVPGRGKVPLLGHVAAGMPIWAEEAIEEYLPYDTGPNPEEYFALRVHGESMLNAGILPDDIVIVHRQTEARSGEIVVALFEDEATIKTFSRKDGHIWLLPENPDYRPIPGDNAEILGKVTGLLRQY